MKDRSRPKWSNEGAMKESELQVIHNQHNNSSSANNALPHCHAAPCYVAATQPKLVAIFGFDIECDPIYLCNSIA
ncbi:hypothetical protein [Sphingomonas sp. LH128]|uniref:hypothetical protein n=1 Tax=Sphingomonas sp. LH128 TaxID=473781 RepID=UPI00155EE005|nr:hypothetical protein [Sphingomonas sp. LH128]